MGVAVTDAGGRFRIDYLTSDFTLTPFSPFINVEFTSGPDVYFTAQLGSVTILSETQANGRQPGRENVGHCFCVELCSKDVLPPDVEGVPHWQQVEIFDIHPFPSLAGFSAQGYAGGAAASYVFAGGATLKGNCPLRNSAIPANPLEYRVLIGEWSWPGGTDDPAAIPTVAPASLAPLTQVLGTHVGYMLAKYAMTLATLGFAEEFRADGVAANTLWPRTTIATAAVQNLLGGDRLMAASRTPEIYADAAHLVLTTPSRERTGQSLLVEDVLAEVGITDLSRYAAVPGTPDEALFPDVFL